MSQLNVQGFGAEAYVAAMAEVMPYSAWQPYKRMVRDIAVREAFGYVAIPIVGSMMVFEDDQAEVEAFLVDEVYGALPTILLILWPLILRPIAEMVIRRLLDYWRNRPEAVHSMQDAARAGS